MPRRARTHPQRATAGTAGPDATSDLATSPTSFTVETLGVPGIASPIRVPSPACFVDEGTRIFVDPHLEPVRRAFAAGTEPPSFEVAGPRARIFFDPSRTRAAIATCGGLSPGLNDVIRSLVVHLRERYGVAEVLGVENGLQGLENPDRPALRTLAADDVETIQQRGGTILGTSRGAPPIEGMVDALARAGIDQLFAIGGDGTMRGALAIWREIRRRDLPISIVGIPKTIDNDIPFVRRSFGFETAVTLASQAVRSAATEARSVRDGIGLVKLMGRDSGYIAASATLATGEVDFCLVPEVPFVLDGAAGLLARVAQRLDRRRYAVIVVAEGAAQELLPAAEGRDPSGNRRLADVGSFLRDRLSDHFAGQGRDVRIKYIDPSYLIRSASADAGDSLFCSRLAQNAVHAAMAGKTALLVGYWHGRMTHVPLAALEGRRKTIDPHGELWRNVVETTGQPLFMGGERPLEETEGSPR